MNFFEKLKQSCNKRQSLLCIGLDPRCELKEIVSQNTALIKQTAEYAACYKPNIAFYEAFGAEGLNALTETIQLIPGDIPILLDAKRNDIGATAEAYARGVFDHLKADAVTLNPYMGRSSAEPFLKYTDHGLFFLCRTSNPGAEKLQTLPVGATGEPFYRKVARECFSWRSDAGLVVAGNDPDTLGELREMLPDTWFLAPGIGAQGGSMREAVESGLAADGYGILPVVVRGIANADDPAVTAKEYRDTINLVRESRGITWGSDLNHDFGIFMIVFLQYYNEKIHGQALLLLQKQPDNLLIMHCKKNVDNYYPDFRR